MRLGPRLPVRPQPRVLVICPGIAATAATAATAAAASNTNTNAANAVAIAVAAVAAAAAAAAATAAKAAGKRGGDVFIAKEIHQEVLLASVESRHLIDVAHLGRRVLSVKRNEPRAKTKPPRLLGRSP